ncbi:hypothetical protein ACXZ9C_11040 [Streptococcus agalactiae]
MRWRGVAWRGVVGVASGVASRSVVAWRRVAGVASRGVRGACVGVAWRRGA